MQFDMHAPRWARQMVEVQLAIIERIDILMSLVQIDQATLDALAANLETAVDAVKAEIDSLKQSLPAADLSGLDTALSNLQALEVPAVTPTPVPTSEPVPAPSSAPEPTPAPASDPTAAPDPSSAPPSVVEPPFNPTSGS